MSKLSVLLFLVAGLAKAQFGFGYGIGVKGGFPFTDQLTSTSIGGVPAPSLSSSDNYIVGPAAELRIPLGFAVEVDGLYRKSEYTSLLGTTTTKINASAWEIPYLAKWRFPIPLLKPFISGGGTYRSFTDLPSNIGFSHNGWVGGLGLELRIARLRISAETRYVHWNKVETPGIEASPNQGEVLFGIMF
jgi:hypothetical protein